MRPARISAIVIGITLATTLSGCVTMLDSIFGFRKKAFESAPLVQNPSVTGKVDDLPTDDGNGTTFKMESAKNDNLCFNVVKRIAPAEASVKDFHLESFTSPDEKDETAPFSKPKTRRVISSETQSYTYQDKEVETIKDDMGRVIATAERPVTRVGTYTMTTFEICFPMAKTVTKSSRYLVVKTMPENWGQSETRAIWRIAE